MRGHVDESLGDGDDEGDKDEKTDEEGKRGSEKEHDDQSASSSIAYEDPE